MKTRSMNCAEAGKIGGETTREKYGKDFFREIGRKGGYAARLTRDHEYYQKIGSIGGKKSGEVRRRKRGQR